LIKDVARKLERSEDVGMNENKNKTESGGVPYFKQLGEQDAANPARKRMRSVPQNFKLAYLNGWWAAKKSK